MNRGKPYKWEEVREFLVKELAGTKNILTFGTIGSLNVNGDIDLIVTKKPSSKTSDFFRELHGIFDSLNENLYKRYGSKSVRFSTMLEEQFLQYLKVYGQKDLGFHTMIYFSYPQVEMDWATAHDVKVRELISKEYVCLLGSPKDLFSKEFKKKMHYDSVYNFLYHIDKINSHYPEKLFIDYMNKMFDYVLRKRLGVEAVKAKDVKNIRNLFYRLCDELDKSEREYH